METSFYMIPAAPHNNKNYSVNNIITDDVNRFRSSFFFFKWISSFTQVFYSEFIL